MAHPGQHPLEDLQRIVADHFAHHEADTTNALRTLIRRDELAGGEVWLDCELAGEIAARAFRYVLTLEPFYSEPVFALVPVGEASPTVERHAGLPAGAAGDGPVEGRAPSPPDGARPELDRGRLVEDIYEDLRRAFPTQGAPGMEGRRRSFLLHQLRHRRVDRLADLPTDELERVHQAVLTVIDAFHRPPAPDGAR